MSVQDVGHLECSKEERPPVLVLDSGLTNLVRNVVDQRARTRQAAVRGRTMIELAAVLRRSGMGAEVAVEDGDDVRWSMKVYLASNGEDTSA